MTENTIYNADNILITTTLARFGRTSYPIASIGSVRIDSPRRIAQYVIGALLIILGFFGLSQDSGWPWFVMILGAFLIVRAFGLPHKLMLRTASGDQQAYNSRKLGDVEAVKAAIEKAVTSRG